MNKRELLAFRPLKATTKMMRMAAEDIPQKVVHNHGAYSYTTETVQYDLFMRCMVQNGILKVSLFLPRIMRLGCRQPAFDLFIDREARKFLTFDHEKKRWLKGKLDRIDWYDGNYSGAERWLSKTEANIVKEYLSIEEGSYFGILKYQRGIRYDELLLRHKRQTDPWDADLAQIPALPKDWERWVAKVGIPQHFIFYHYVKNGAKTGYCTYCEKDVPIKNPRYNKQGRCPCCRHQVTYKSVGKAGMVHTENVTVYLMQRCTDGFTIRCFKAMRSYPPGKFASPIQRCHEIRRAIYTSTGQALRAYYWGDYKHAEIRWIETNVCSPSCWGMFGKVYGRTLPDLSKRGLSRTGVLDYVQCGNNVDPEKYLAVLERVPQMEQIAKVGLSRLVNECLESYYSFSDKLASPQATSLTKMLGINTQELRRLRKNNGSTLFLAWLRYEKGINKLIPDHVISWFCAEKIKTKDLSFICDRMSMVQIYHYMRRQMEEGNMDSHEMLTTWADYLSMATRFHLDVNDSIVYRVRKLRQRHDELAARGDDKDAIVKAGEILRKYPHVEQIYSSLEAKYGYTGKQYMVMVPTCIEDIIHEGEELHHCIANSENYWERIETGESFLLFLRKTDNPQRRYYTMEIEPNGTVRQLRTYFNRKNEDIDEAKAFLMEWQAVVKKRLTEEDRKAAARSSVLREQEFEQLRRDNVVIYTGDLAGRRLVDVLTADLMENAA